MDNTSFQILNEVRFQKMVGYRNILGIKNVTARQPGSQERVFT